jgi:hypothetical protein
MVNPSGAMANASTAASAARVRGLLMSTPPARVPPICEGVGNIEHAVGQEGDVDAVEHAGEPVHHAGQVGDDGGELLEYPTGVQRPGVVHDRFETQHVFALGVALQGQQSEVDLEQGEVPPGSLDHDCLARRQVGAGGLSWALADPEQGAQSRHVQPDPGPVDDGVEGPLHYRTGGEDQVAAVFDLVDRVGVAEAAARLLGQIQPEAQAGGVDPPVKDLAQAPYRPGLGQGICDLGQAFGFIHPSETVALLRKT